MELFKDSQLLTKEVLQVSSTSVQENEDEGGCKPNTVDGSCALENKIVGLYFAASWCPASRLFTPLLCDLHEELERRKAPFQIVAVPCDKTKNAAEEFYETSNGEWLCVQFGDSLIGELKEQFSITAIPKLVILRPDGSVITYKGRKDVQDKGIACFRNWISATNLSMSASLTDTLKEQSSTELL